MNNQGNSPYTILSIISGVLTTLCAILFPLAEKLSGTAQIVLIVMSIIYAMIGMVSLGVCAYKIFKKNSIPPEHLQTLPNSSEKKGGEV